MNAMVVIFPYKVEGLWAFDDAAKGLDREPFVDSANSFIDDLVAHIPEAERGFRLLFSANPFPGYMLKLEWRREEFGGNWYVGESGVEGWLCPALFKYFESAPPLIYAKAEAKPQPA